MSTTIDERVVEMRFDADQFNKNIDTSIQSINKLNSSLDGMSSKGFDGLSKAANNIDLSGIGNAVDSIASRFSNMGLIAMTAIQNITNRAIDAGIQITKSLTIDLCLQVFRNMNRRWVQFRPS